MEYVIIAGKWFLIGWAYFAIGLFTGVIDHWSRSDSNSGLGVMILWPYYWVKWSVQGARNWCSDQWAYIRNTWSQLQSKLDHTLGK